MTKLNNGTVQVIVRDGKVMVVALNLGGGDLDFPEDDNLAFTVQTLMAGIEYQMRMQGSEVQALDFAEPSFTPKPGNEGLKAVILDGPHVGKEIYLPHHTTYPDYLSIGKNRYIAVSDPDTKQPLGGYVQDY